LCALNINKVLKRNQLVEELYWDLQSPVVWSEAFQGAADDTPDDHIHWNNVDEQIG
jgi:hypothetical protein